MPRTDLPMQLFGGHTCTPSFTLRKEAPYTRLFLRVNFNGIQLESVIET